MGLAELIQDAVHKAFVAIGNVAESATFRRAGTPRYNPALGKTEEDDVVEVVMDRAVFVLNYQAKRPSDGILPEQIQMIVERRELPGITPKIHDVIIRSDGSTYKVIRSNLIPATSAWECDLQRAT